ncbi:jacalin-related lectin 3-like isoform X1 [Mangifera indica]|uniref:jacalin-related lectin 3-like isoform X1 n=1 Tax=Mangifera indica TaxID=29780 RepID=UPI001CFA7AE6|nr:jacalin-related lectin 3-like isoform X1 [Mangifera indica]
MDNLTMPCISTTKLAVNIPQKYDILSEFSSKSVQPTLPFTKKGFARSTDAHLNHLCRNGRLTEAITVLDSVAKRGLKSLEEGEKKPLAVAPWGGQNGVCWDDGVYTTVRQLVIAHGTGIESIQIEYDKKGSPVWSKKHGGNTGSKLDKVKLDYPDEFLTSVHGYYGTINDWGTVYVRSLTFQSNRKTYGPFGIEQGTYFSLPMTGGKIVGFHGRSSWYLDAIGIYLKPLLKRNSSKTIVHSQSYLPNGSEKVGYSLVQGSVGESYDIVLAVKQKDSYGTNHQPTILSQQSSSTSQDSSSDDDNKTKHSKKRSMDKLPIKVDGILSYGPWGGSGGSTFDDGTFSGIRQINISRNVGIVSIRVCYDHDGQAVWGSKHGGTGGFRNDRVIFDYPYEILTHMTGTYGPLMYMGPNVVKSLTFHTTKGKHGPFGEEQGLSFTHKVNEGKIIGFHGKEGLFLDAIGVHVTEGQITPQSHPVSNAIHQSIGRIAEIDNPQWSNKLLVAKQGQTEEVAYAVIKEPSPFGPGPWGGDGGRPWDDGVFSGIKQIFVTRAEAIQSIQIEYDRNGQSLWSIKHGGSGGAFTHRIKLEYPHEVLNCLSGYYGPVSTDNKSKVIKSLTFYTSRGKYGPFGEEVGTYFTSTTTQGKVVGFHGRSSYYLDAIGVHVQHWLENNQKTIRSFFKFLN